MKTLMIIHLENNVLFARAARSASQVVGVRAVEEVVLDHRRSDDIFMPWLWHRAGRLAAINASLLDDEVIIGVSADGMRTSCATSVHEPPAAQSVR